MKVNICGYDVNISAKHEWQNKGTKVTTLEFLNHLSIILDEASENYKNSGYDKVAETTEKYADSLYEFCKDNGLYSKFN